MSRKRKQKKFWNLKMKQINNSSASTPRGDKSQSFGLNFEACEKWRYYSGFPSITTTHENSGIQRTRTKNSKLFADRGRFLPISPKNASVKLIITSNFCLFLSQKTQAILLITSWLKTALQRGIPLIINQTTLQ
jgi:hypothetical protein